MRVSKSAIWLKKDRGTHEWQIDLVQVLEKLRLFERQTPLRGGAGTATAPAEESEPESPAETMTTD